MPPKGEQGRGVVTSPPWQPARMAALKKMLAKMQTRAGVRGPVSLGAEKMWPIEERPGDRSSRYTPAGYAMPLQRSIRVDPGVVRQEVMDRLAQYPHVIQSPKLNAAYEKQKSKELLAHELGHVAESQFIPNREASDRYTDEAVGAKARSAYWLTGTPQGRGEIRRTGSEAILRRNRPGGLPTVGPGGVHSSPNEQYAQDFAASQGAGMGSSLVPSNPNRLRAMMHAGLIPAGRGNWNERGPDGPVDGWNGIPALGRLAALGIDHTTMPSLATGHSSLSRRR